MIFFIHFVASLLTTPVEILSSYILLEQPEGESYHEIPRTFTMTESKKNVQLLSSASGFVFLLLKLVVPSSSLLPPLLSSPLPVQQSPEPRL